MRPGNPSQTLLAPLEQWNEEAFSTVQPSQRVNGTPRVETWVGPRPWVKWAHQPVRAKDVPAALVRAIAIDSLAVR